MNDSPHYYDQIGGGYSSRRRPDPNIYRLIHDALPPSASVLNIGAGTGSYEPDAIRTLAAEPSLAMIRQRPNRANLVQACAEALPFADASFDTALALLTIHHWPDLARGLGECVRISRRRIVILTWDPASPGFWLTRDYLPQLLDYDRSVFPCMDRLRQCLGKLQVQTVPIPWDCVDGFTGAYWRRPEAYLDPRVRSAMSSFSRIAAPAAALEQLRADLNSGVWKHTNGHLLKRDCADLGYRLVTASPQCLQPRS